MNISLIARSARLSRQSLVPPSLIALQHTHNPASREAAVPGRLQRRWQSLEGGEKKEETTHFGFKTVGVEEKAKHVHDVFSKVAERYDIMNDAMSAGMHRLWKDQLVDTLGPMRGTTIVDLAGGTGDVAFRILQRIKLQPLPRGEGGGTQLIVCDINEDMLGEGRRRAHQQGLGAEGVEVSWVRGDAEALPFADGSVDCLTIAFGLRNVTRTAPALSEIQRVLRKGGRFLCMEFSHLPEGPVKDAYDAYSFNVIPAMGKALAGDAQPYEYLVESIRKFPKQAELEDMMREAGMRHVTHTNILGGLVAIHSGFKA